MPNDETLAISADQFNALSADAQASLRSQLLGVGFTQDQLLAKIGGDAPAQKTPAALPDFGGNGLKAPPDPALAPSLSPTAGVSYESKVAAFHKLQAAGVDHATLVAAAHAEGVSLSDLNIEAPAPAETLGLEEANARLAASSDPLAPSLSPSDFHFQFEGRHIEGLAPEEIRDIYDMFAHGLHEAGVPVQLGQSLVSEMMNSADKFAEMDDIARALAFKTEGAKLQRMGNVNQLIADAELAWSKLPVDFQQVAAEHFLFHSADAYNALANAGAMLRQREARQKK